MTEAVDLFGGWLTLEALIWLFPVAFILHDFEEIIMVEKWVAVNKDLIRRKLPGRVADNMLDQMNMTTAQFAAAVLVMFLFVSSSAYLAHQYLSGGPLGNIHIFIVTTTVFFIHLFMHLGQSAFLGKITPGAVTSLIIILPYSLALYSSLFANEVITWSMIWRTLPYALLSVPVLLFAHWVGKKAV